MNSYARNLLIAPSKNLAMTIPIVLSLGFISGLLFDTTLLKKYILLVTILMIYPTMIGFKISELLHLGNTRLLLASFIVNFIIVPIIAYVLGIGLAVTSFGPNAALMVSLAFLIQGQAAAWFISLDKRYTLLPKERLGLATKPNNR